MTTASKPVTDELLAILPIGVVGSNAVNLTVTNTGTNPLTAFAIGVLSTDSPSNPVVIVARTDSEFSAPASGSVIQHAEQNNSAQERENVAPTTLPAGSTIFMAFATTTSYVQGLHQLVVFAQTASGQTTTLDVYVGRA